MLATRTLKNDFFFEKFYRGHDPPRSRRSLYTPPVETPTPAHPDGLHTTGNSAGRARCKAGHATHRHTRPDAGHAAPVCTRYQTGRAGTIGQGAGHWTACATCPIEHAQTDKIIKRINTLLRCVCNLTIT